MADSKSETRLECSAQAACLSWLLFGILYATISCVYARALNPIALWFLYGTPFLLVGWIVIGLPLVTLGDRLRQISLTVVVIGTGLAGFVLSIFLVSVLDFVLTSAPNRSSAWWTTRWYLFWGTPGFVVAAVTGGIYQILLRRSLSRFHHKAASY